MVVSFVTVFSKFNLTPPSIFIINNGLIFIDSSKPSFKVEELDFFDLEFPIEYGPGNVVKISKNTIYCSVYLFV